ncbi:peptide-methionine (R)-S-oxide reductase MsrB [Marinibactrum halimedae]|uniref:Peptide methionine sulfoxide reductase MsrB n=1 Tax=Marinibactrum halimedae TaxID=1444977 RepID=A0AA37T788_9GAMM|nr:peptide-methionine (R)-S-oxide reductase MsrB [Marinibactrum halimedae]MCD9457856.1 peptide-methionine (R)-S-oxide reductase MsrB [Marinibactrum halimedae]GLS26323.1 peptide methionine sulfoxide reductase MsrB [Marinibactrum halimedae]
MAENVQKDDSMKEDEHWRDQLTAHEYHICREKGTERPFTGEYWDTTASGQYLCRCCKTPLFSSESKFDAGCGWPSFFAPSVEENVSEAVDRTLGMVRTEILCTQCGCHLGHVFPDGPAPTGLRYCVNSASIRLQADGADDE